MKRPLACLSVLIVGCGGGSTSLDDLATELATVSCAKQWDCCSAAERMEQYGNITHDGRPIETEEQCVSFAHAVLESLLVTGLRSSIDKGRATYDGGAAGACLDAMAGLTCAEYNQPELAIPSSCRPFITPRVGDGGACTEDWECTSDNCVGADNPLGGQSTDGMCQPLPGAGEPCEQNCETGHYCDFDSTAGEDICKPTQSHGTACRFDDECASDYCDDTTDMCADEPPRCDGA